jgi:DeoR/GlpR family transcriptional regulator of sugar metabolism
MGIPEKRRLEIRKAIADNGSLSVSSLANIFKVSELTIRRDLNKLEQEGHLEKVHGGAILKDTSVEYDPVYLKDIKLFKKEKEKISVEAAKRIKDNNVIIIESGTTCLRLVNHIGNKNSLTVFSASVPIVYELWKNSSKFMDLDINICGGLIEKKSNTLIGSQAVNYFNNINADIAFISAVGISIEKMNILTNSQLDADVTQSIIQCSKKNILLVDSSKFLKKARYAAASLKSFDEIITDSSIDSKILGKIKKNSIKVTLV